MSPDRFALLPMPSRMERLSLAYVKAIAAQAGFVIDEPSVDRASRDGTIHAEGGRRPKLDFQAKAQARPPVVDRETAFFFDLKMKNYNDLRNPDLLVPQVLFVVLLPEDRDHWIDVTDAALTLRYCGYWSSLRGAPEVANVATRRIEIPLANRLDAPALLAMMRRIDQGGLP